MNVSALARREPLHEILPATLSRAWSVQFDRPFHVATTPSPGAQEWRLHELLSVYTHRSIGRRARRFVADGYRYTRTRRKLPARWVTGTLAASKVVQARAARDQQLWVRPSVPDPGSLVIVPGNQRVRIFDLRRGVVRAVLKDGFDPSAMQREVELRRSVPPGPFLPITAHDAAGGWFEEPLIDGFSLAVCPPWRSYRANLQRAAVALDAWLERTAEQADVGGQAERVAGDARRSAARLERTHAVGLLDRVGATADALAARAHDAGRLDHAWTHGDLQPANVVVARRTGEVTLIDWEACGWRLRWYDWLVHGLLRRVEGGREERLAAFVQDGALAEDLGLVPKTWNGRQRAAVAAVVVLEDLAWALREADAGRSHGVPRTLVHLLEEAERLVGGPKAP